MLSQLAKFSQTNTRIGLYVDAFNVYYGARALCGRSTSGWRWLDLVALAFELINPRIWSDPQLTRFVYCTAPRDREGDPSSLADQQIYVNALCHRHSSIISVVNGKYVPRVKSGILIDKTAKPPQRVPSPGLSDFPSWFPAQEVTGPNGQAELLVAISTFEEKGSDVNLASNVLIDVLTKQIDAAMIFSNGN